MSTLTVSQSTDFYPGVQVEAQGSEIESQAGATVLLETVKAVDMDAYTAADHIAVIGDALQQAPETRGNGVNEGPS